MSVPMYFDGVMIESLTHGSSMSSMSPASAAWRGCRPRPRRAVEQADVVLHRRRGGDEVEVELALEPLLDDLHVEQAQEAAAEAEAEGDRALGLVGDGRVVEVELLERVAQQRVVLAG